MVLGPTFMNNVCLALFLPPPLELQFSILPAGGEPQGEAERAHHVLPGPQLWQHPQRGLEGPAGLPPGSLQGQAAPTEDGGGKQQ